MNWLNSLKDQLPLMLVLSPVIGFVVTLVAARTERDLIRPLAVSNSLCSLLILAGVVWQFELESADALAAIRQVENDDSAGNQASSSVDAVHDLLSKRRAETIRHQLFAVDGINLWPTLVLIVLTGMIVWAEKSDGDSSGFAQKGGQTLSPSGFQILRGPGAGGQTPFLRNADSGMFVSRVLLFEAASVAAFTSCDLRGFLLASGTAAIVMSVMIGTRGGSDRRSLAERFLFAQFAGGALVMLGFAMLVVSVPWMKIEDSPTFPTISANIGTLVYETEKWSSRNQLAFQYQNEVFPWMLLVLSLGFAIQFGLFPFHSWQVSVLSETHRDAGVLCLAGTVSVAGIGWHRFVVPLAPDLLVSFDRLILIPALGGAIWGSLLALAPGEPRRRIAFLFLGLSGVSLLGCYCFTTIGMSGAWLMQQQLILVVCAAMFKGELSEARNGVTSSIESPVRSRIATRTLLLMMCLPALGLFAAGSVIVSELVRDSLLLVTFVFVVGTLVIRTIHSILNQHDLQEETRANSVASDSTRLRGPLIVVGLLAVVVNLFPSWMLHQCEPEFDRIFRRFERPATGR